MEIFRQVEISGTEMQLRQTLAGIVSSLAWPWSKDEDKTQRLANTRVSGRPVVCFSRNGPDLPKATLFLGEQRSGCWSVLNIVPIEISVLPIKLYNAILEDFFSRFIEPASISTGVKSEMTPAEVGLNYWISSEAESKLLLFSLTANKHTGSAHPADRERWFDFITTVFEDRSKFGAGKLQRWLIEEEHWPEDIADDLAIEYEFAMGLLEFVRSNPAGIFRENSKDAND